MKDNQWYSYCNGCIKKLDTKGKLLLDDEIPDLEYPDGTIAKSPCLNCHKMTYTETYYMKKNVFIKKN